MNPNKTVTTTEGRDLVLTRVIEAPRERVFRAWTEPDLLKRWFAPLPCTTSQAETDVRPGGSLLIAMRTPDGNEFPVRGVYLDVVPDQRIVFTDAFVTPWEPSGKPFMTVHLTFEDIDGQTKYTARILHWTTADREQHETMGFHQGWPICTEQLATLVEQR